MNVRPKGDVGGGNAVGAILVTLATDIADPVERLTAITARPRRQGAAEDHVAERGDLPTARRCWRRRRCRLTSAMTGSRPPLPFAFNLCVSNVPGPRETLYLTEAAWRRLYPVSIPIHGMALNITLHGYADS